MSSPNDEFSDAYNWVTRSAAYMIYPPGWEEELPPPYEPPPPTHIPGTDIPYITEDQHREMGHFLWPVTVAGLDPEGRRVELIRSDVTYSLYSDIEKFFTNVWSFIWADEPSGSTWLSTINHYIWRISEEVITWMAGIRDAIVDQITGLANFLGNIYTWIVWNLVDDVINFVTNLFRPITDAWSSVTTTLETWFNYVYDAIVALFQDPIQWVKDIYTDIGTWLGSIKDAIWDTVVDAYTTIALWLSGIKGTIWDSVVDAYTTIADWLSSIRDAVWNALVDTADTGVSWLSGIRDVIWDAIMAAVPMIGPQLYTARVDAIPTFMEQLRDILLWLWDNIKAGFLFVAEDFLPAVWDSASGALGWLKDEFTNLIGLAYDEILEKATALVPVTPERSAGIAAGMFGAAVGFGSLAHGMALGVEMIPNLKYMGVHYLSAFVARMGSFGTISSATMGVIAALAIREPFSYYMKSILRPSQPSERDLQIMAVKPDIDIATFRQGMEYQGYTDFWIDAFERTMYHEPSYFEMSMLGEDEAATPEWLFTKSRRSGYTVEDAHVFVSSMIKKVTRDQRKEYYKMAFNAFKEGYISATQFQEHLDHLDIRPEAKDLATRAANMAYQTDLTKELISTYRRSFSDDLITDGECRASLSALGMTEERVDSIMELEWVKKEPKILKAERKEIETEWRDIQSKYSRVYVESFRKGLITEGSLAAFLTAIGIKERAAKATARYEAIKLVPKPKPLEIIIPALPPPPEPPVYED